MNISASDPRQLMLTRAHNVFSVYQKHLDGVINLDDERVRKEQYDRLYRADSDSAGLLRNALTYYSPKVITVDYSENQYADPTGIVPRMPGTNMTGVSEIVKTVTSQIGKWESTGESNRTGGRIDVGMSNITYGSQYKTAFIEYTSQELDRIVFAQQNGNVSLMLDIVQMKMAAVKDSYNRVTNDIMAFGMPDRDVFGLHTHPNITRITAPYRPGRLATRIDNIALFALAINEIQRISRNLFRPDVCIMPSSIDTELSTQTSGTATDNSTKKFILDNTSIKAFIPTPEASIGGRTGAEILHFMMRDTDTSGLVTKDITQLAPPVFNNGVWRIVWDASFSGVHVDRPYKHLIMELPLA